MPVRVRITLIFSFLVFVILSMVCVGTYFFAYQARINNIKTRLTNRAITTARLLSQKEIFQSSLVQRIDSSTTLSFNNKTVQAYNAQNREVYVYSDTGDTLYIDPNTLDKARAKGDLYFTSGSREFIAHYYTDQNSRLLMIVGGEDVEGRESLRNLAEILFLSFIVGIIFVLITGYFFSKGLLLPVKKISQDIAEISARNLTRRIETGASKDEWYQLSVTVNDLLNRMQESFDMQGRFIANASHELSTPLTAISSQLEVHLQRERTAGEYKKLLQSVYHDVQQLKRLTQALLEFAKASGGPGGLDIDLIRIDEIILNLPAEVSRINPSYSVRMEFDGLPEEEENLLVFGSEALLLTAINNIVVNACKYSDDHEARVKLQVTGDVISIVVKDRGRGIEDFEIEKIFQPFYRIEKNRGEEGFGLGLSLASRIIKLHKGKIEVHSGINQGAVFQIDLPSAKSLKGLSKF